MKVHGSTDRNLKNYPDSVPDEMLSESWAQRNHLQSLQRLNQRGGMSVVELLNNIRGESLSFRNETQKDIDELNVLIEKHTTTSPGAECNCGYGQLDSKTACPWHSKEYPPMTIDEDPCRNCQKSILKWLEDDLQNTMRQRRELKTPYLKSTPEDYRLSGQIIALNRIIGKLETTSAKGREVLSLKQIQIWNASIKEAEIKCKLAARVASEEELKPILQLIQQLRK